MIFVTFTMSSPQLLPPVTLATQAAPPGLEGSMFSLFTTMHSFSCAVSRFTSGMSNKISIPDQTCPINFGKLIVEATNHKSCRIRHRSILIKFDSHVGYQYLKFDLSDKFCIILACRSNDRHVRRGSPNL